MRYVILINLVLTYLSNLLNMANVLENKICWIKKMKIKKISFNVSIHLHASIFSCKNSWGCIFKNKNVTRIYRSTLLTINSPLTTTSPYMNTNSTKFEIKQLKKWTQHQIQSRKRKGICNPSICRQFCHQVDSNLELVYLKSLGCCKKYIWWWFALFNFRVITKNNMMHQRKNVTMSLSFQFKMSLVRTVGQIINTTLHKKSLQIDAWHEINPFF